MFSYYFRICDLGDPSDFCKINDAAVVSAIRDKDVFVEEILISAELGGVLARMLAFATAQSSINRAWRQDIFIEEPHGGRGAGRKWEIAI